MKITRMGRWVLPSILLLSCTLLVSGCGGGGGGGGGGSGTGALIAVSFVGFPTIPSTGPTGAPLPSVFRDEVIEFKFDGELDAGIFGGFVTDAQGAPTIFRGLAPNATGEILYFAYVFQAAARNSLEIRENAVGGPFLASYIVGRNKDKPDTLVIDPRVSGTNSFGLPSNSGYQESREYTYRIPQNSGIAINGNPVQPIGVSPVSLPITTPIFSPQPSLSILFFAGVAFSPDPIPPEVLSISTLSGAAGNASNPIPTTDGFEILFSKLVDNASIDPLRNMRVVNNDILTQGASGLPSQVPGSYTFQEVDNRTVVTFVPQPGYGPGLGQPPTQGYTIAVRVGSFGDPTLPPITGQPQGSPPANLPLANSLQSTFVTAATPGAAGSATYIELFDNQDQLDSSPTFDINFPNFNVATWSAIPSDPCDPTTPPGLGPAGFTRLQALRICGNPLATTGGGGDPTFLGSRFQFDLTQTVSPSLFPPSTIGLLAPFDDTVFNQGPTSNPNGGNHLMQLYEDTDVGNNFGGTPLQDSLELIEWGPVSDIVNGSCYPSYQAWFGMTTRCAPALSPLPSCTGLSQNYNANYDVPTVQAPDPILGGVLCSPIGAYVIANSQIAHYMAFPINQPVFDYNPNDGGVRHLIVEQNLEPTIPPPPSPPNPALCVAAFNVNRFVAGANFPLRRVFGPPFSIQLQGVGSPSLISGNFGGWDRYDWRFTWVKVRSHAQSKFYFQETIDDPTYESITIIPSPLDQPKGTEARWEIQGTDFITAGGAPQGSSTTPWLIYWDGAARDPSDPTVPTGQFFQSVLGTVDLRKYIRFRVSMRANHLTSVGNGSFGTFQTYSGVIFNVSF